MPSHLRLFFWLIAAVAAYWVLSTLWYLEFPPPAMTEMLAKLPPAAREMLEKNQWQLELVPISLRALLFVGLAWLAAFKRHNWARLGVLVLFLITQIVPLILAFRYGRVGPYLRSAYLNPVDDLSMLMLALAVILSFTGNARASFAAAE
jgi:hypothetical protein